MFFIFTLGQDEKLEEVIPEHFQQASGIRATYGAAIE